MAAELVVRKLPPSTNERDLISFFSSWTLRGVRIPTGHDGRQRGYAIVVLANLEDAEAAITQLNGTDFNGRTITVSLSERQERACGAVTPSHPRPTYPPRQQRAAAPQNHKPHPPAGGAKTAGNALTSTDRSNRHSDIFLCGRGSLPPSLGCDPETPSAAVAPGELASVLRITPKIVAPLAAYIDHLIAAQQQPVISHSTVRSEIERIARFFVHVFYSAIREREISDDSKRKLADYFWAASAGQAARLASDLGQIVGKTNYRFLHQGARWWLEKQRLFLELIQLCNDAIHFGASQFDEKMRLRLPNLNAALAQFDRLGWILLCARPGSPMVVLNGATHDTWIRYQGEIPAESVSLSPFLVFRDAENRLDVFQNRVGNRTHTYNLLRIGDLPAPGKDFARVTASNNLASEIERSCPFDDWSREFETLDHWKIESEGTWSTGRYDFSDLTDQSPQRLYGRDDELAIVKGMIANVQSGQPGVFLLLGQQGVGKSALMWKLLEGFRSTHAVVPFFFQDRDPRCHAESFCQAAAIAIARYKNIALHTESAEARFREAVLTDPRVRTSLGRPLLLLDGLDAMSQPGAEDLGRLFEMIKSVAGKSVSWICASQPFPELLAFARNHDNVTVFEVPPLKLEARRAFLRGELQANAAQISNFDLWGLTSDKFVDGVASQPDAGLPFYLRAVLDSAIKLGYRNPEEIPPTIVETWQQTIRRLQHDMIAINLMVLLSVAVAPLGLAEIQQVISGLDATQIESILGRHECFTELPAGWSIKRPAFGRYIRETVAIDIRVLRSEANKNLVRWASNWNAHKNRYALEYLPRHLENDPEALRRLAFDDAFLEAQREQFPKRPELPRDTIHQALIAAKKSDSIEGTLQLALRHADYVSRMSRTATLADEFRSANYGYVFHLATLLDEEQEQLLWKLLALAGVLYANNKDAIEEIVAQMRLTEYRRGVQRKYEIAAAILLGIVATAASESGTDLGDLIVGTAAKMLSGRGMRIFFESLGKIADVSAYVQLLPSFGKPRLQGVTALAEAVGRQHVMPELSRLLGEPFHDEIRLHGALGLIANGDFKAAANFALPIRADDNRRLALSSVAAGLAVQGVPAGELGHSLVILERYWNAAADDDVGEHSVADVGEVDQSAASLLLIQRRAFEIDDILSATQIVSKLGVVQWKLISSEDLLQRVEANAQNAGIYRDWVLFELCRTYMSLKRWDDVERVSNQMSATMQVHARPELLAGRITDSTSLREILKEHRLSIGTGSELAARLSRNGHVEGAMHVSLEILLALHSVKAEQPSLWGRPRVLGEFAAMLHCIGKTDVAHAYFEAAQRCLDNLSSREWRLNRIFALIDLADAASSALEAAPAAAEAITDRIDFCLSEARRAAIKLRHSKQLRSDMFADILGTIWEIRYRFNVGEPSAELDQAFKAAREEPSLTVRISALVEIARHQAKCGKKADSHETLWQCQQAIRGVGVDKARVLLGRSLCGDIDGLDVEIENSLNVLQGDARYITYRAEVERCLQLHDFEAADVALAKITDVSIRSHAARSIARKYAEQGNFLQALVTVRDKIVASRSDLIPDVAEAIASYAGMHPESKPDARRILLDLMLETAPYLDGTYRLIAAIIRSRAFDLEDATIQELAKSFVLVHLSQDQYRAVAH